MGLSLTIRSNISSLIRISSFCSYIACNLVLTPLLKLSTESNPSFCAISSESSGNSIFFISLILTLKMATSSGVLSLDPGIGIRTRLSLLFQFGGKIALASNSSPNLCPKSSSSNPLIILLSPILIIISLAFPFSNGSPSKKPSKSTVR